MVDRGYGIEDAKKQKSFAHEQISNFAMKMENSISKENLITMYNNLHNLNVREGDISLIILNFLSVLKSRLTRENKFGIIGGFYSGLENKVVSYSPKGVEIISKLFKIETELPLEKIYSHELLHMSSSIKKKNKSCAGFYHCYYALYAKFSVGRGINEGYTELLNERIFDGKNDGGLYEIYKIISGMTENIVGKDKMTQLYFNADLKGLVLEISRYISKQETKQFIINLDLMVKEPNKINDIMEYLLNLYINKITYDIAKGNVTKDEANIQYEEFKLKVLKVVEVFNEWVKTKKKSTEVKIDNFDINSGFEEQKNNFSGRSRGNIRFVTLFMCLNFFALLITIIYLLSL